MVTVSEASTIIFDHLFKPASTIVKVQAATGRVLAEPVIADRDFPPFHRVSMDGIAIQYQEWLRGRRAFAIEATQAAGEKQKKLSDASRCIEVMTGAKLPAGCDTVIRYEDLKIGNAEAKVTTEIVSQGQSVHQQAMDARKDQLLLEPGILLAPSEVALLASVGKTEVKVAGLPRVAIISTGDELVEIEAVPTAYQIRRSNSYALQSALFDLGADATCFHLEDEKTAMEKSLIDIIRNFDVLILSGGVSKGKFDFVPVVLENIGIRKLFHQVSQRPGKPFWFGRSDAGMVAFALPGNPVSTFMCFYKYVRPWILRSLGASAEEAFAILGRDFSFPSPLTYFLQVAVKNEGGRLIAYPDPGGGSGDFANLKKVSGFLELPLEKNDFKAGEVFPYISFRQ
ncbi:MAG: molybdopterin molybdotransferase MoeA [Cyclobacteriaceae bacterium]